MEIVNLGKADGLPPVDWAAVVEKLEAGSAPGPEQASEPAPVLRFAGVEKAFAGGYAMDAPPPAEHTAMEKQARPAPLVQILPTTPQSRSVSDEPKS